MPKSFPAKGAVKRRNEFRKEFWSDDYPWQGPAEVGYFCSPRTLPFVLQALADKKVSGQRDPTKVYLELLSRHIGQGVIELDHEEEHAFASGLQSVKTWRERMKDLETAGFIKTAGAGRRYAKVFLVHPAVAMEELKKSRKISTKLWQAYRTRAIEAKEPSADQVRERNAS